ncbi:MAG TPA: cyclase family protein [Solirubrobacteraceae bacterium]|jgi:kynurenine formamidase
MSAPGNWGRWGSEDERGAANLLSSERVLAATGAVASGRVISLGEPLDKTTAATIGRPSLSHYMVRDGGDYAAGGRALGRSRYADDVIGLSTHTGTHVDALVHVWYGEQIYNGHSQAGVRSGGASRCGVEKLGPLVGRGLLLDVAAYVGEPYLPAERAIDAEMLEGVRRRAGVSIESGDIVLIRTGWLGGAGDSYLRGEPGVDFSGAAWLAANDVALVGADNYAVEVLGEHAVDGFPVHELLLRDHGIPLMENVVLDALAQQRPGPFLFVANPLPLRGATASPLAPVAIL